MLKHVGPLLWVERQSIGYFPRYFRARRPGVIRIKQIAEILRADSNPFRKVLFGSWCPQRTLHGGAVGFLVQLGFPIRVRCCSRDTKINTELNKCPKYP